MVSTTGILASPDEQLEGVLFQDDVLQRHRIFTTEVCSLSDDDFLKWLF